MSSKECKENSIILVKLWDRRRTWESFVMMMMTLSLDLS